MSVRSWDDALHDSSSCARFSSLLVHVDVSLMEDIHISQFTAAATDVREVGPVFSSAVIVVDFFIENLGCITSTDRDLSPRVLGSHENARRRTARSLSWGERNNVNSYCAIVEWQLDNSILD